MTQKNNFNIHQFGEHACLIKWEEQPSETLTSFFASLKTLLVKELSQYVQDINFSFNEMAIYFNYDLNFKNVVEELERIIAEHKIDASDSIQKSVIEIPVCYDKDFGIDSEKLCAANKISTEEMIDIHSRPIYPVHFIGFLPGFPYLGEVDQKIAFPRRENPRTKIDAGSVGIANNQTGIYPIDSAGGWNIIGRTPIQLFDKKNEETLLKPGDYIKFISIGKKEFNRIKALIRKGDYEIKTMRYNA